MYERILVPLDGSRLSEQALPYANLLGKSLHARVELLRAYGTMSIGIGNNRDQVRDYVNDIKGRLEADDLGVSATALEGNPASHRLGGAERRGHSDRHVYSRPHGNRQWILGSVTNDVLRATTNPLLLVRSRDQDVSHSQAGLRSIIVPLDGSPIAEQILPHAVSLDQTLDLRVTLVRVGSDDQEDDDSQAYLSAAAGQFHRQGVTSVEQLILHGHAGQAIIEFAQGLNNHLLAITTHGRSGVGRIMRREGDTLMSGSIADRMVKYSGGPVLVLNTTGKRIS